VRAQLGGSEENADAKGERIVLLLGGFGYAQGFIVESKNIYTTWMPDQSPA
jgi:hypothetical protein